MNKICTLVIYTLLALTIVLSPAPLVLADTKQDLHMVDLLVDQPIKMRDGVTLSANVYRPRLPGKNAQAPVIIFMTPYIRSSIEETAWYLSQRGFNFVAVDVRGRGDSGGEFRPLIQEGEDGYDIVEWAAKQSWSNGRVGMLGGSYVGYTQWATLKEFPPHLETILPIASVGPGWDFPMRNNISYPYVLKWLNYVDGNTNSRKTLGNSDYWNQVFGELYQGELSFKDLPSIAKTENQTFDEWQQHPTFDQYWRNHHPTTEDYQQINIPILTISGFYDADYIGAMNFYKQHMQHGSKRAKNKHYLILGPWHHGGTRRPTSDIDGVEFGPASVIDMHELYADWFRWTLTDGDKPAFLKQRVAFYRVGDNEWDYEQQFTPAGHSERRYYLSSSDAGAGSVFHSGRMTTSKFEDKVKSDKFVYDPLQLNEENKIGPNAEAYLTNQSSVLNINGDGLVYHSKPLQQPVTLGGEITASLWLSMNVKDTDLTAEVYEILPDGTSVFLASSSVRARHRNSLEKEDFVIPGKVENYQFKTFYYNVRKLTKGSRIRFALSPINSAQLQKNYNSGGIVSSETRIDAVTAEILLHHTDEFPSFISLPLTSKQ